MRGKRVYEVCMNVFSTVCILELRATHAKYSHALSLSHDDTMCRSGRLLSECAGNETKDGLRRGGYRREVKK